MTQMDADKIRSKLTLNHVLFYLRPSASSADKSLRSHKSPRDRRSKIALACFALAFVAGQAGFRVALAWRPLIGDIEFGRKLDDLRSKLAEKPGRPLVVMLGSSRVATGFRPDVLPRLADEAGREALAFNFAQVGTGPQVAHLVLKRMLDQGIRPDCVLVEFWPPFWCVDGYLQGYLDSLNLAALDWSSAQLLARYLPRPGKFYARWLPAQLVPMFASRSAILSRLGPSWAPGFDPEHRLDHLDANGWWSPRAEVSDADRRRLVDHYRGVYAPRLANFQVRPTPDRALVDILSLCKREGIRAAVIVLPEGSDFRSLYPPESLRAIDTYLARLSHKVPVIDARAWIPDSGFGDGHHLLPTGATLFSERLAREALSPLLLDHPSAVLARPDSGGLPR
jgi:hypothetical protein